MNKKQQTYRVVIEISANSGQVKYEFDHETKQLVVDRIMPTSMSYPCNYGFIPNTLGGDGDPVDVLVHASQPLLPCSIVEVKPIGVLLTEDEKGGDHKILAVPISKIDPVFENVNSYKDLPEIFLKKIEHFFEYYKKLEKGKFVKISGWEDAEAAFRIIQEGVEAFSGRR